MRKSVVLLRNQGGMLPLDPKAALAVAGRGAHNLGMQCGGWSMEWLGFQGNKATSGTTVWDGITAASASATLLNGAAEVRNVQAGTPMLVVVGEKPYAEGAGDRKAVGLDLEDVSLVRSCANGERKVAVVLLCGRPLALPPDVLALIDALAVAWLPGTEGGGVADVLFGIAAARGKLSYSWPRDTSQPQRHQRSGPMAALYPLGFGIELAATRRA